MTLFIMRKLQLPAKVLSISFFGIALLTNAFGTTERFGFAGPEIFPIDNQISQLRAADINGDGKLDLILVNNSRAKINLLINRTGETNTSDRLDKSIKPQLNELPPDARFRIESIASEKRIAALLATDLNSDGLADLVYYGEPKELVVQYNQGTNTWSSPRRWQIGDETSLTPNALATGDLNGDKKTDLVLLSENYIHVLYQNADNTLGEPVRIPYVGTVKSIQVLDIDGDGRDDLLLVNWDDPNPFRFRLQTGDGQLGPEYHFPVPSIRSYWADDLDGDQKTEIMSIAQNSGRAQVSNFMLKDAEPLSGSFLEGQFQVFPLNKTGKTRRGMVWTDLNADGLPDLLVAEPDSGQMTLHLQKADGTLVNTNTFSTFSGVTDLAASDWNNDGKTEIFVMSPDERQIGITQLDDRGRIPFPTILRMEGKPLAMTVGIIDPALPPMLAFINEVETNRFLVTRTAEGNTKSLKLSDKFKSTPASLTIHDVDQDGLADLVVLIPYERIKILRQIAGGEFEEHDVIPPGGNADQPWLSAADVDADGKPELLLAQRNFLRAVVLTSNSQPAEVSETSTNASKVTWSFSVKEQINGASSNSRIIAATPLPKEGSDVPSLFLLDAERKVLTLSERDESGVWQVVRNLALPVSDFRNLQGLNIGSDEVNSIGFLGINSVAWMNLDGKVWNLTELDYYETPIKGARLNDVISGDLNNNGRKDLVFLETARNYVDLVMFEPPHRLVPANRWPVFEERTFRSRRTDLAEPREALIADVTGDGKNDLIVLVHDRVLVYVQE